MNKNRIETVSQLSSLILRYLDQHPEAADTQEGIRYWWLGNDQITEKALSSALESLTQQGKLIKNLSSTGQTTYCKRK